MYSKTKNDIVQDYYQQHFPNDGQRFVAWYVRIIHAQDASQVRYCIMDGPGDKQIDAVVIDDDAQANNLLIKCSSQSIGLGVVIRFLKTNMSSQ